MSALAASALPSLVLARGHRISKVAEVPLVVDDSSENLTKTSKAVDLLKQVLCHTLVSQRGFSSQTSNSEWKIHMLRFAEGVIIAPAGQTC